MPGYVLSRVGLVHAAFSADDAMLRRSLDLARQGGQHLEAGMAYQGLAWDAVLRRDRRTARRWIGEGIAYLEPREILGPLQQATPNSPGWRLCVGDAGTVHGQVFSSGAPDPGARCSSVAGGRTRDDPGGGQTVGKTSLYRPVAGIYRDDIARLNLALAGVSYPAQKWQLIAHVEREPVGRGRPDRRTIGQLWALPTGRYPGLAHVLVGAARTARGHPHRSGTESGIG